MGWFDRLRGRHTDGGSGASQAEQPQEGTIRRVASDHGALRRSSMGLRRKSSHYTSRHITVRTDGLCKVRRSLFGAWQLFYCVVRDGRLCCFERADVSGKGYSGPPALELRLIGMHLEASGHTRFCLIDAPQPGTGSGAKTLFEVESEGERDGWLYGLAKVPGLYRRAKDYYVTGDLWGQGTTSKVYECCSKLDGRTYAMKRRAAANHEAASAMHNELQILQLCAKHPHPSLITLHDYFFDPVSDDIVLVIDFCTGGEVLGRVARQDHFTEDEARAAFRQVAEGVAHLHRLGIAHRDVKPQNLLYLDDAPNSPLKITDYGFAKVNCAPVWQQSTPCGTVAFMAPEVVRGEVYGLDIDVWGLGCLLYVLLSGELPFMGESVDATEELIKAGRFGFESPVWKGVSEPAKALIRSALAHDPSARPTAAALAQHPWLTGEGGAAGGSPTGSEHGVGLATPEALRRAISGHAPGVQTEEGVPLRKLLTGKRVVDVEGAALRQVLDPELAPQPADAPTAELGRPPLPKSRKDKQRAEAVEQLRNHLVLRGGAGLQDHALSDALAPASDPETPARVGPGSAVVDDPSAPPSALLSALPSTSNLAAAATSSAPPTVEGDGMASAPGDVVAAVGGSTAGYSTAGSASGRLRERSRSAVDLWQCT